MKPLPDALPHLEPAPADYHERIGYSAALYDLYSPGLKAITRRDRLPVGQSLQVVPLPGRKALISKRRPGEVVFYVQHPQTGDEDCKQSHVGVLSLRKVGKWAIVDLIAFALTFQPQPS